jgi:hypothetical protein
MDQTLLVAQGHAIYGCAVATVDMSIEEIKTKLTKFVFDARGRNICPTKEGFSMSIPTNKEGQITGSVWFKPNPGIQAPEPCIIDDTGHGQEDLKALNTILTELKS